MKRSDILRLKPAEVERLVAELWQEYGYDTELTSSGRDEGIDIIAVRERPFTEKQLIQVKRYSQSNKIGSPEIQQYSALKQQVEDADSVSIVTTSGFTQPAIRLAEQLGVNTVDGEEFVQRLNEAEVEIRNQESASSSDIVSRTSKHKPGNSAQEDVHTSEQLGAECPKCHGGRFHMESGEEVVQCISCGNSYLLESLDTLSTDKSQDSKGRSQTEQESTKPNSKSSQTHKEKLAERRLSDTEKESITFTDKRVPAWKVGTVCPSCSARSFVSSSRHKFILCGDCGAAYRSLSF